MSGRLSDRQHRQLLDAIQQLQSCRSIEQYPATVNAIFGRLIGCDSVSYNDVYPGIDRIVFRLDPEPPNMAEIVEQWRQFGHQHPLVNYVRETGDGSAHQVSDFLSRRQYHALDLYQGCYRAMQVEHQMSVSVSASEDVIVAVAMNRQSSRFSETERLMANLLRPHVCGTYMMLLEMDHLRGMVDNLSRVLDETGEGVILWSHQGVVLQASPLAAEILSGVFGWRRGRTLPAPLDAWARQSIRDREAMRQPFALEHEGRRLAVRLANESAFHYVTILLREEAPSRDPALLLPMGISRREAEILHWLTAGKSNAEIASILGLSPLTAKTHVINIFRKLGVENRTSAARMVHEFLAAHSAGRKP
jgi:DNA-binding CsgD family transcriptional regulator/PAS domain-containing protein